MRILLVFIVLFHSSILLADQYQLTCQSSDMKSSINIKTQNDRYVFTYTNSAGKDFFPLYTGLVTAETLPHLKMAKKKLSGFERSIEFSWPVENCLIKAEQPYILKCFKEAEVKLPENLSLRLNSFSTSLHQAQSFAFSYEKLSVRFILTSEDQNFEISIPFSKERCKVVIE